MDAPLARRPHMCFKPSKFTDDKCLFVPPVDHDEFFCPECEAKSFRVPVTNGSKTLKGRDAPLNSRLDVSSYLLVCGLGLLVRWTWGLAMSVLGEIWSGQVLVGKGCKLYLAFTDVSRWRNVSSFRYSVSVSACEAFVFEEVPFWFGVIVTSCKFLHEQEAVECLTFSNLWLMRTTAV